jgi:DNA-binding MarR family transcriptional regulator
MRMTELADPALISRSGMTRRVARLVDEGLVRQANVDCDAGGVIVALTDAGVARLTETWPVHARAISDLFVAPRDDQEPPSTAHLDENRLTGAVGRPLTF